MYLKNLILFLSFCLFELVILNFQFGLVSEKNYSSKIQIEAKKRNYHHLVCHGESDRTPLLNRKYKAKGLKVVFTIAGVSNAEPFYYHTFHFSFNNSGIVRLPSLRCYFKRGPPEVV